MKINFLVRIDVNLHFINVGLKLLDESEFPYEPIALNCEMGLFEIHDKPRLARVSIVDYNYDVLFDAYCYPEEYLHDNLIHFNGLSSYEWFQEIPFEMVRSHVQRLIHVS